MLLKPVKWVFSLLATALTLYVFFVVPIGQRTLFQHVRRIAGTREAADLGHDVRTAGQQVYQQAREGITGEPAAAPTHDAGPAAPAPAPAPRRASHVGTTPR